MQAVVRFRILQEEPSIIPVSLEPIARGFVKSRLEGISVYVFLFSFFLQPMDKLEASQFISF